MITPFSTRRSRKGGGRTGASASADSAMPQGSQGSRDQPAGQFGNSCRGHARTSNRRAHSNLHLFHKPHQTYLVREQVVTILNECPALTGGSTWENSPCRWGLPDKTCKTATLNTMGMCPESCTTCRLSNGRVGKGATAMDNRTVPL